jgi:SAM-dependent methyltransferase
MRIGIGIPCFQTLAPEVAFDYMRMLHHFGKRMPEHDFFLITKVKSEQFRARNSIVQTALQFRLDYLLFLDDDHIFSYEGVPNHEPYGFLQRLLDHKKDIVGALYYHRTGEYRPVLMKRSSEKAYTFLNDSEITGDLQEVDVQGGGVMLINMKIFDKILPPYFEPEMQTEGSNYGTDIQLCRKAQDAGFSVWCDTSIVVGHLKQENEIVHAANRDSFIADNMMKGGMAEDWMMANHLKDFREDVHEYTKLDWEGIVEHAIHYNDANFNTFHDFQDKDEYYRQIGVGQLCRQAYFHSKSGQAQKDLVMLKQFQKGFRGRGLDFGCGSAPVGYELARKGHHMDFVDLDGAYAYEFLKWRCEKHGIDTVGWQVEGPYDFMLFLDSIEHLTDWEGVLDNALGRLKEKGVLLTNFFDNYDYQNPEHINMNHAGVAQFLADRKMIPKSNTIWMKDDNFMGGAMSNKERKRVEANGTDSNTSN